MMSIVTEEAGKKALCARLARVEGQLRGLQKLIQAEAESEQVAQQMTAARKALDKAFFAMVATLIADGKAAATCRIGFFVLHWVDEPDAAFRPPLALLHLHPV